MNKRTFRLGCLFAILIILIFLAIGGGWWFFRSQTQLTMSPQSSVFVFLLSPINEDEIDAGDFVPATVQATAPEAIQSVELFLDGQSLGKATDSPSNASWTWQAWPLGIHSFYAQATTVSGQVGYSQVILVNVLAGDGSMPVIAGEGQTLEQIGAGYGVPPDQMAGANPKVDPSQPLPGGKQVQVPITNIEPPNLPVGNLISIKWKIKFNEQVDKAYCYVSVGNGIWEKIPKNPFTYFYGQENFYTQMLPYKGQANIQVQCWGWLGETLKYLGQGQTDFNVLQPPNEVQLNAEGFVLVGIPQVPEAKGGGPNGIVTPPFALREPADKAECTSHGNPLLAPFICDTLLNANVKKYTVLVWEWKPEVCWPGYCKYEINEIDGYMIYQMDPLTQASTYFLKEVDNSNQKVTAIPLPWVAKCYGVTALADGQESEMVTYCPGIQPTVQKITLTNVAEWLTTEDVLKDGDNCAYTQAFMLQNNELPGFGSQAGEVFVGAGIIEKDQSIGIPYCFMDEYYQGGIKFNMTTQIPINAVIQKAILRFSRIYQVYQGGAKPGPEPSSCVLSIAGVDQSWSAKIDDDHWVNGTLPSSGQSVSVNSYSSPQADVTAIVANWIKNPSSNHGFVLRGWFPALPTDDEESSSCISALTNFQLNIYYFAAP